MEDNEDAPVMGTVPRQKVTSRCKSIDRYGDSDVDLTRKRSFSDEYFKRVARDLKSIPCLLLLGNIFAFVFLIIWSNITKHLFVTQRPPEITTPAETTPPLIRSIRELHMCSKPRCGAIGHAINYGVNSDVQPCSNVLEHVCGRWLKADTEIYEKVMLGSARLYVEDMYWDIKRHLETMPISLPLRTQHKVSIVYRRCLYEGKADRRELLADTMNNVYHLQSWPFANTPFEPFRKVLARFLRYTGEAALLHIGTARLLQITRASSNAADEPSNDITLALDCPTFVMPRHWLLTRNDADKNDYAALVMNVMKLYQGRDVPIHVAKNVVAFEINNAYVARKYCHRRKLRKFTIAQLETKMRSFHWLEFLREAVGESSGIVLNEKTPVLIRSFDYLKYVASLVNAPKENRAVNYIGWRVLRFYGPQALRAIRNSIAAFRQSKLNETVNDDWKRCLLTTNEIIPIGMGRVYVEAMTRLKTFFAVQDLVTKVIFSFKYIISQAVWLDAEAKVNASTYLGKLKTMIGVPKWVADDKVLDMYHANFTVDPANDPFFVLFDKGTRHTAALRFLPLSLMGTNQIKRSKYWKARSSEGTDGKNATADDVSLAGVNVRPLHTFIFPSRVVDLKLHHYNMRQALVFDVNENSLLLPAGILQPPYFDPNVPLAINYGGLGVLILHDMVREFFRFFFDDTEARWRKRTRCINNRVYRKTEESSGSLDENQEHEMVTFTMMTVRAAYNAYHYALGADDDDVVPGVGAEANPDQLFMLTAVRTLCTIIRDRHFALVEHSKETLLLRKVTAALQSLNELVDAFKCPDDDKRNAYYYCMESTRPVEDN
ncbi:hypothetical protein V5799_032755 [Amblyomma americanum]|uniref:M13 family peptidase n=1 Tax=Amblyomma americanum TaxID=6943 RepID=A0AAQ4DQA0_AMBAM